MFLQSLKLTNFKNYESEKLLLSSQLNCFVGLNGMGKTNLLDAIYYCCLTKSQFQSSDKNLIKHGEAFFRLDAVFEKAGHREQVVAKFQPPAKKEMERNGVQITRLADHIGQFPVVMIAPDDVRLVQDGSEERRRFMDAMLSQLYPNYLSNLLIYNNLLRQRNALLKSFWENKQFDATLLEAIDRQMPEPAHFIYTYRAEAIEQLVPFFQSFYQKISGGHESVGLSYQSDCAVKHLSVILTENSEKDRVLQRTTHGPHRDELILTMDNQPVKRFASQGQLKSFLLALRLAQYEWLRQENRPSPLLLLDDIFDKLDVERVQKLIELLVEQKFGQIFITDTHATRVQEILGRFPTDFKQFIVHEGSANVL